MRIMKRFKPILTICLVLTLFSISAELQAAPPAEPAKLQLELDPVEVFAGGETELTLLLTPIEGVKINRYPKIKLELAALDGVVAASKAMVGNDKAPPPGDSESNYFKTVDPVKLPITIDPNAKSGTHELEAKLTYFYCVSASGFCAPKSVPVSFAVKVR